jgi:hypothetical protein
MKEKSLLLISLVFGFMGCSPKILPTAETIFESAGEPGTIILNSTGYYKGGVDETTFVAEKQAFETLLFRGIPGSEVSNPLIGINEAEIKEKNKKYFDEFYTGKRYRTFVMSSEKIDTKQSKGFRSVKIRLKINVSSLTKDLEYKGVKRGFGL